MEVRAPGHASTRPSLICSGCEAAARDTADPLRARQGLPETALRARLDYVILIFKVSQGFDFVKNGYVTDMFPEA